MAEATYAHNHVVNPETGFLENPAYATQFDSVRKEAFLKNYRANGLRIRRACREMGLSEDTVGKHLHLDPLFREKFDAVEKDYLEELEATSKENALNPKSVIERIFQLKCLIPEKYGQENKPMSLKIEVNIDGKTLEAFAKKDQILEAQIVASTPVKAVDNQHSKEIETKHNPGEDLPK